MDETRYGDDDPLADFEPAPPPPRQAMPRRPFPRFTYSLIGVIVAVWLAGEVGGTAVSDWLYDNFAESAADIWNGQYWRLLTYGLLHGGLAHLIFNAYGLHVIGAFIEGMYGPGRTAAGFALAVLGGSVLGVLSAPSRGLFQAVGASGGLFGLVGMHIALMLNYRKVLRPEFRKASWINLALVLGINAVYGFLNEQVDNAGHLGGLLAGLGWGLVISVPLIPFSLPRARLRAGKVLFAAALTAATVYAVLPKPASFPYQFNVGEEALAREDFAGAILAFERAAALQPDEVNVRFKLAVLHYQQENYETAAVHARAAQRLLPDNEQINRLNQALAPFASEP